MSSKDHLPTEYPPFKLPNTEVRQLSSNFVEEMEYRIYVALPEDYQSSSRHYPAFYLLDAWMSFGTIVEAYRTYRVFNLIPELIIVGISDPGASLQDHLICRTRDYIPTVLSVEELTARHGPGMAAFTPASGGAPNFLRFIRDELLPFMEREYRIDASDRGLFGYSYGGLFVMYTLFNIPRLFQRYFIGSAAGWWDNYVIFEDEAKFAQEHKALPVKVFASVGSEDITFIPTWDRLRDTLEKRNYVGLELTMVRFDGEDHLECSPLAHMHALRHLYKQ